MSEQLFIAVFFISTEMVYLQRWHGWCHMKLLPSRRVLCTPYNHAPCHFMQSHIRACVFSCNACLAVTCHLHFWQNDRGLLRATAVTRRGSAQKVDHGDENSPCRDSNPRPFDHESGALTTELSPLPEVLVGGGGGVLAAVMLSIDPEHSPSLVALKCV